MYHRIGHGQRVCQWVKWPNPCVVSDFRVGTDGRSVAVSVSLAQRDTVTGRYLGLPRDYQVTWYPSGRPTQRKRFQTHGDARTFVDRYLGQSVSWQIDQLSDFDGYGDRNRLDPR